MLWSFGFSPMLRRFYRLQMPWIDAEGIPAGVIEFPSAWNRPKKTLVSKTMGIN
jgi:hypothetical protein